MLVQLNVRHFALIDQVSLDFGEGLNVLSGETGVGKSILIDAVKLLLGDRAQTRDIRFGEEEARVEGAFDLPQDLGFRILCDDMGIPIEEGDLLILSRQIKTNGRNTCRINGTIVPLAQYRTLAQGLIIIFGQKDRGLLQDPQDQLALLDAYLGKEVKDRKDHLGEAYHQAQKSGRAYQAAVRKKKKAEETLAALQAKVQELTPLNLQIGESDRLRAQHHDLAHWEGLQEALATSQRLLYGADHSAYNLLIQALEALERQSQTQETLGQPIQAFKDIAANIQDLNHDLLTLKDRLPSDPGDLQALEDRLALFDRLERREGKTIDDLIRDLEAAQAAILAYDTMDGDIRDLQKAYTQDRQAYQSLAQDLSAIRKKGGEDLSRALENELADLAMAQAKIRFTFTDIPGRAHGIDEVVLEAQTNPGMPFLPVADVASGGETSRLMLALQTVIGRKNQDITYIFDEIDTGIGGMVLEKLGDKLMALSHKSQVICVTHATPLAARADQLFVISKETDGTTTWSTAQALTSEDAIHQELARMMGGQSDWHLNQAKVLRRQKDKT